jgi:hypothetical protein
MQKPLISRLIADQELIARVMQEQGHTEVARAGYNIAATMHLMQGIALEDKSNFDLTQYKSYPHVVSMRAEKNKKS